MSESERTLAAIDRAEDVLAELRGDLASGDTLRVIRWVQNDGALVGPSDALRAAAARIRELEAAIEKRGRAGHNDTCDAMLLCDVYRVPDLHDACSCGHSDLVRLLAHTESEDRNG